MGTTNPLGAALSGYAQDQFGVNPANPSQVQQQRMKRGGILGALSNGVNRYKTAQQAAQQAAPTSEEQDWAGNALSNANSNPALTPDYSDPSQPIGAADEIGGASPMPQNSMGASSYAMAGGAPMAGGEGAGAYDDAGDALGGAMDGISLMSQGQIVTRPTLAIVGEKSPEAVVPLTSQPQAKVSGEALGQGLGIRTRWRRPGQVNASARYRPISADIPLRPGVTLR